MRAQTFEANGLREFLKREKIGTLSAMKKALGTSATMTVFRKLKALGYLSSYSDCGRYYTLSGIPDFDDRGLWSYRRVWFSRFGNLKKTARAFVESAECGWTAQELDGQVYVETKQALLSLTREQQIAREKMDGIYVYFSADRDRRRIQRLQRQTWDSSVAGGTVSLPEMKAAIVLFYSLLNEKQRRLYAGLEAMRQGHGGDRNIAAMLDLDIHTVAKGRRELFGGEVLSDRVRRKGGDAEGVRRRRGQSYE